MKNGWRNWILGALFAIVLALASIAWGSHESRLSALEGAIDTLRPSVAVLESRLDQIQRSLDRIEQRISEQSP